MSYDLAISLGHNSSAVLIKDGEILAGYEEERFTGLKADSVFPIQAISELNRRFGLPKDTNAFVSHWFINAQLPTSNKYWRPEVLRDLFPNGQVDSLSADFTHHDAHLESAMVFAGDDFSGHYHAIVADGFGNYGECVSIYEVAGKSYRLLHRVFGFEKSMGMLYQYATAFMGMKMHNHEYKMLAYEVHIGTVLEPWEIDILKELAWDQAQKYLKIMNNFSLTNQFDPVTDLSALPNVQDQINTMLSAVLEKMVLTDANEYDKRVVISWFVQHVVEAVILTMARMHNPTNLLVVGGLFYNVKLNHLIAQEIRGKLCAMPLAGDQGAALGVYNAYKGDLKWPDHLNWGPRDLGTFDRDVDGIKVYDDLDHAYLHMRRVLKNQGWVNLVRGNLEYGPRALCNTSTIAIPDPKITQDINRANARTMEMPFAPVMTESQADDLFLETDKIHKSLEYMIVTRTYAPGSQANMMGAAHFYPQENVYTGRPQITADPLMVALLKEFGPLVNTSFNFHGVPIVRSMEQIVNTHESQWRTAPDFKPTTIIIRS